MKFFKVFLALALLAATLALPAGASAQDGGDPTPLPVEEQEPYPTGEPSEADPWLTDVLPDATQGAEALALLDAATLDEVAAQNSMSTSDMTAILANDGAAWLDADGLLLYIDAPIAAEYLEGEPPAAGPFPNGQTFLLHSKPGSSKVIYLDFNGYALPAGTGWNNGNAYTALPWDVDGNGATFNQVEHDTIQSVWQRISEDYAPFDVDITTEDPGFAAINRTDLADTNYGTRVVITDSPSADICASPCGGVAYGGVFDLFGGNGHAYYQPAWSFSDGVGDTAHNLAEVSSHEAGHTVGLGHDGIAGGVEYYAGHGVWSPIMGNSYPRPVTQWSKGEYTNPSNTQDDFVVMNSNGLAYVPDDADGSTNTVDDLVPGQNQLIGVTPAGDVDSWRYVPACDGVFTFDFEVAPTSPNLNLAAQIYENGTFLEQQNSAVTTITPDIAGGMGESITRTLTAGTAYTLAVIPAGSGSASTGFTNYGSIGEYRIDVTEPAGGCCASNDAYSGATSLGTVGEIKATITGDNTCATSEAGENTPGAGLTLWYSFVAEATGSATVSTCSATTVIDTTLGVYSNGANLGAATLLKADDDPLANDEDRCEPGQNLAQITLPVMAATTYRVQVDGFFAAGGLFELSVQQHFCFGLAATQVGSDGPDTWSALPPGAVVSGLDGNDNMTGTTGGVTLCGDGDVDDLRGTPDPDTILGGPHGDSIRGLGGNDALVGDAENVVVPVGGPDDGDDTIRGGGGEDVIAGNGGNDNIIAGGGLDEVYGDGGADSLNGGADADLVLGGSGNDVVRGQGDTDQQFGDEGDDVMRGHAGNDIMFGGIGDDTLLGASGDDQLFGEDDNDTLWAGTGADAVNGGAGTDFCHGGTDTDVDTHTQCETVRKFP